MPSKRTVPFTETAQPVHDPFTGALSGEVISRHYEGENVQKHFFVAQGKEKPYSLGATTNDFNFFDWPDIVGPILDQGFTPQQTRMSRGGLKMHTILAKLDGPTFKDPMNWDSDTWGTGSQVLHEMVIVSGGIKPGSGFHYHRGFFRKVCVNGLVVESLGLGSLMFNHANYESSKLVKGLFGQDVVVTEDNILGEKVANRKGIRKLGSLMEQAQDADFIASQPRFVRELLAPVGDLPTAFLSEANIQFQQLINKGSQSVYEMDIANVLTSAHNLMDKAPARLAFKLLPAQRNLSKLAGVLSL
jgi:hypothetical protein